MKRIKVMIAGIGGASLGTEIYKSLKIANNYEIFGCDISPTAYGLYEDGFSSTFHIDKDNYISSVKNACLTAGAGILIPGGEQPSVLLSLAEEELKQAGITLISNNQNVVSIHTDKKETFKLLSRLDFKIPLTREIKTASDIEYIGLPCIVKPATGSGGSASVFYCLSADEALIYANFINRNGSIAIAQEYITPDEGEFTVGVLSLPNARCVGSVALQRVFDAKLSVSYRGRGGLISSGYSQGLIDDFPEIRQQAEKIAEALKSTGPLNIQGRVKNGVFLPFEINPRFSASTFLRAQAGFNEIDIFIQYLTTGKIPFIPPLKIGWYLRSLTECYISPNEVNE